MSDTDARVEQIYAALENALDAWLDCEKAEQGFGPQDIGWSDPRGDFIAYWLREFARPAIADAVRAAVANAKEAT